VNAIEAQLLQRSIENMGQSFQQSRAFDATQKNHADEMGMRQQMFDRQLKNDEETKAYRDASLAARNKAKFNAYIADPDHPEQGVGVEGPMEELEAVIESTRKKTGKEPLVLPKAPTDKPILRTFKIGNVTTHTFTPEQTAAVLKEYEAKGINPDVEEIIEPKIIDRPAQGGVAIDNKGKVTNIPPADRGPKIPIGKETVTSKSVEIKNDLGEVTGMRPEYTTNKTSYFQTGEKPPSLGGDKDVLPFPKSKTDAVKGKKYNTVQGPMTWDGSKFVP
jgi:hypothetical protein